MAKETDKEYASRMLSWFAGCSIEMLDHYYFKCNTVDDLYRRMFSWFSESQADFEKKTV